MFVYRVHQISYIGDIFGYLYWYPAVPLSSLIKKHGTVFSLNMGIPAICCFDNKSSKVVLEKQECGTMSYKSPELKESTSDVMFNFWRNGEESLRIRTMLLSIIPQSPQDPKFLNGIEALKSELKAFGTTSASNLPKLSIEKAIQQLIVRFTSGMLTGDVEVLPLSLLNKCCPIPMLLPVYPYIPKFLLPSYHTFQAVWPLISTNFQACPYWTQIADAAKANSLSDQTACDNIGFVSTINAFGLASPMMNAFFLLKLFPDQGKHLLENDLLLESFCWELMRFNGPPMLRQLDEATFIESNKGETFHVKSGTWVYSVLAAVQLDETIWPEPLLFKPDRFLDGKQPYPSIAFGCPLDKFNDDTAFQKNHYCAFMKMVNPFLQHFVRILINDFTWELDSKTQAFLAEKLQPKAVNNTFYFNYSLDHLKKGSIPNLPESVFPSHFPHFISLNSIKNQGE